MRKKVLLMGKSGSGKTSMRSIIFANYIARDTRRLGATMDVEHSHVRFLGNLSLNLWDCGGQEAFMENYLTSQRDYIFANVEVLIYVFDVESKEFQTDMVYYRNCIEALRQNSQQARIFIFLHKMDLIAEELRVNVFKERSAEIQRVSSPSEVVCFATTIWDESLYRAWSAIVYSLVPNVNLLETHLKWFCEVCDAKEVILFEKTTFLVISHSQPPRPDEISAVLTPKKKSSRSSLSAPTSPSLASPSPTPAYPQLTWDSQRFEKLSNIIKQFKLSCASQGESFQAMHIRSHNFSAYLEPFTPNTCLLIVLGDSEVEPAVIQTNIQMIREHFEQIETGRLSVSSSPPTTPTSK
jgi:Ras-related GTP-binding protein A/B